MNVYQSCPTFENEKYILRLINHSDVTDLLKVYSDVRAVPLFNSDNCHGDDFYYTSEERMRAAVDFWVEAYQNGWFVRWSIVDKAANKAVGTIEGFRREADDYFTNCALIRLDLRSDYERDKEIASILSLIVDPSFDMFGADKIAIKAPIVASERRKALDRLGFKEILMPLVGFDGVKYYSYFALSK